MTAIQLEPLQQKSVEVLEEVFLTIFHHYVRDCNLQNMIQLRADLYAENNDEIGKCIRSLNVHDRMKPDSARKDSLT